MSFSFPPKKNKKCAAEAAHKNTPPIAATQFLNLQKLKVCEKGVRIFTENKNTHFELLSIKLCRRLIITPFGCLVNDLCKKRLPQSEAVLILTLGQLSYKCRDLVADLRQLVDKFFCRHTQNTRMDGRELQKLVACHHSDAVIGA